ncbi:UDP-glucose dehydrogenase family protein [Brucella tritici]|uniref:UDP-glucose dehydrogenase family protein n=1 Tax=Brucella tritici TaxID=94626 RepID=UPI00158FEDC9|nr:UDP-glucose/GDP-mannose dehydrogenase family protein [Brucella tritici]
MVSKKLAVVGTGYVGLVAGACFAKLGHDVICVDVDKERIDTLNEGGIPIFEPGLEALVHEGVAAERLRFTTKISDVAPCDAAFIAVGTPPRKTDGEADLSFVHQCARDLAAVLKPGSVIVDKSTVPVGTGDTVERIVAETRPGVTIHVASNPEFLREGSAIGDFLEPDRIVIGCDDKEAEDVLSEVYAPLQAKGYRLIKTRRRSAELIKYASNAFLATKITYINEMADLCEAVDADIADVALGMGTDSRIGPQFLQAGPGYGGSCFPKDTLALVRTSQEFGVNLSIVEQTVAANTARKRRMIQKVRHILNGDLDGKKIAVLGLTFKADTDDMRDSPAIPMIELLQRSGADVHAYDPEGIEQAKKVLDNVTYHHDPYKCSQSADAVVIMTDWASIRHIDLAKLGSVMRSRVLIDLRRVCNPEEAAKHGFAVETIGRKGLEPDDVWHVEPKVMVTGKSFPAQEREAEAA